MYVDPIHKIFSDLIKEWEQEQYRIQKRKQAEQEVKDKEYQRQSEERMVIMKRVFEAEELRKCQTLIPTFDPVYRGTL